MSLPLGAVRLPQEFLRSDLPGKERFARLRQFIDRELRRAKRRISARVRLVIGDVGNGGGTV